MGVPAPEPPEDRDVPDVDIRGATLIGAPPIGHLHLPLRPGLTAIYGPNGVGKTRLLASLGSVLDRAVRLHIWDAPRSAPTISTVEAAYQHGGLHFHAPINPQRLVRTSVWQPGLAYEALHYAHYEAQDVAERVGYDEATADKIAQFAWEGLVEDVRQRLPWETATLDEAIYLLVNGCWFLHSPELVFLADPSPDRGPLASRWAKSDQRWRDLLVSHRNRSHQGDPDSLKLRWHSFGDSGTWEFPIALIHSPNELPLLPPRPEVFGLPQWPEWAALPVLACANNVGRADEVIEPPIMESHPEVNALTAARIAEMANRLGRWSDPQPRVDRFVSLANELIAQLFDDDLELSVEYSEQRDWFAGKPPLRWLARHGTVDGLAIDQLGMAHERYCSLAVQRATAATSVERGYDPIFGGDPDDSRSLITIAVIDEPERALHPAAEQRLAGSLSTLADYVVVSTHGPEILAFAEHRLTLGLGTDAFAQLEQPGGMLSPGTVRAAAAQLGMTPKDILATATAIVLVEGPHDVEVVRRLLVPEMEQHFVLLIPMYGHDGLDSIAGATYLFESTSVPIVICLDNLRQKVRKDIESVMRLSEASARQRELGRLRRHSQYTRSREMAAILSLVRAAVDNDRLDRLHVHPFSKPDIARYLDPDLVSGRDVSWEDLEREFLTTQQPPQTKFAAGDGAKFKKWIGPGYTTSGLSRAADRQVERWCQDLGVRAHRPQDFTNLGELLDQLRV